MHPNYFQYNCLQMKGLPPLILKQYELQQYPVQGIAEGIRQWYRNKMIHQHKNKSSLILRQYNRRHRCLRHL